MISKAKSLVIVSALLLGMPAVSALGQAAADAPPATPPGGATQWWRWRPAGSGTVPAAIP